MDLDPDEEYGPVEIDEPETWTIQSDGEADWALAKIRVCEQRIEGAKELARERIERANAHAAEVAKDMQARMDFFASKLRTYYETVLTERGFVNDKRKTYKLEAGTLSKRAGSKAIVIEDLKRTLTWTLSQPDPSEFIKVEPRANEIKKHMLATGESIPGARIETNPDTFSVSTKDDTK